MPLSGVDKHYLLGETADLPFRMWGTIGSGIAAWPAASYPIPAAQATAFGVSWSSAFDPKKSLGTPVHLYDTGELQAPDYRLDIVNSPIQEQPSLGELLGRTIGYLYANSRPQFHGALYVLVYAALWAGMMQIVLSLISLTPWFSLVLDCELIGTFVGCIGIAELIRGHVKHWLGYPTEDWCYVAMPIGGAVLGVTFAGLMFLKWGMSTWYEPAAMVFGGACFYTLLGWLFQLQAKQKSKQHEAES